MRSRIEDGAGTTNRPAVFEHRLRTLDVNQSLANHISTAQLNGRTGVFTAISLPDLFLSTSTSVINVLSISNNDPINLMIIDRAYIQVFSCTISLPNNNFIATIHNEIADTSIGILNENRYSKLTPIVLARKPIARVSENIPNSNVIRIYPTFGDINELILPDSESIIVKGKPPAAGTDKSTITLSLFNTGAGNITLACMAFIKFMMVPPEQIG